MIDAAAPPQSWPGVRALCIALAFILVYVLLGWGARYYIVRPFEIVAWNPSAGLGLALLLICGLRYWPALAVASFATSLVVRGIPPPPYLQLLGPCIITAGYVAMAALLRGSIQFRGTLSHLRDLWKLLAVAAVGTLLMAIAFIGVYRFGGLMNADDFWRFTSRFWIGHLLGVVIGTPLLLLLWDWRRIKQALLQSSHLEAAAQLGMLMFSLWIVFSTGENPYKLFYLLFLPLIWIAMRHAVVGAVLGNAIIQMGVIFALIWSGVQKVDMSVTEFQFMMCALAVTGLFLGMMVTESRTAHDALEESGSRLRTILATAPDSIITVDHSGAIIAANPAAAQVFGFAGHSLVGTAVRDVLPEFERVALRSELSEAAAIRSDGSQFPVELSVGTTGGSAPALRIATVRDVSHRKELERELAKQQAARDRTAKLVAAGEMAAALAHELHQPLSAIRNYGRALKSVQPADRTVELLGKIESEAARAADVVQRLRDFFRDGTSRLERVMVRALIEGAAEPLRAYAQEHSVSIEIGTLTPDAELLIDRVQMETVLHALVGNAIEAVASGTSSRRSVCLTATELDKAWVRVSVSDTGPGISPAILARLFEPFATTKRTGTGLGLAMSRTMVEAQGGALWAETKTDGGAVFHLTLPRAEG